MSSDSEPPHRPGFAVRLLLLLIRAYQLLLSPWLGNNCRYMPSCSQYTAQALQQHGLLRGSILGVRRIVRCTPWHSGGYDPVPPVATVRPPQKKDWLPNSPPVEQPEHQGTDSSPAHL